MMWRDFFWRLVRPAYWIQNSPTDAYWTEFVENALEAGDIAPTGLSNHYAKVGGVRVWIGNYPHAYGSPSGFDILPAAKTRKKLREALLKATLKEEIERNQK